MDESLPLLVILPLPSSLLLLRAPPSLLLLRPRLLQEWLLPLRPFVSSFDLLLSFSRSSSSTKESSFFSLGQKFQVTFSSFAVTGALRFLWGGVEVLSLCTPLSSWLILQILDLSSYSSYARSLLHLGSHLQPSGFASHLNVQTSLIRILKKNLKKLRGKKLVCS